MLQCDAILYSGIDSMHRGHCQFQCDNHRLRPNGESMPPASTDSTPLPHCSPQLRNACVKNTTSPTPPCVPTQRASQAAAMCISVGIEVAECVERGARLTHFLCGGATARSLTDACAPLRPTPRRASATSRQPSACFSRTPRMAVAILAPV
jgi:hypothetical protein